MWFRRRQAPLMLAPEGREFLTLRQVFSRREKILKTTNRIITQSETILSWLACFSRRTPKKRMVGKCQLDPAHPTLTASTITLNSFWDPIMKSLPPK
jgi:hypothetical protein